MAIVIGDIHGDLPMARAFLAHKREAEYIALGDFVDSRDPKVTFEDELACLDLLLNSDCVLVWGNHDLAYTPEQPWPCHTRFGRVSNPERWLDDPYLARFIDAKILCHSDIFESRYQTARSCGRFTPAHATSDGWLCTHAGISTALTAALPDCPWNRSPSAIASWLTSEFNRELVVPCEGPLFKVTRMRGGYDPYGGIFWYDERLETNDPDPRLKQIFGHTKVEGPLRKLNYVNIHIEDGWWIFDTESEEFVRLRG